MQEAPESGSSASVSNSFSSHPATSIKEEDCSPEKERPPEAEYISSRCVLFTYFQGDISAVVDEHFSRALSQPSSFSLGSAKVARNAGSWRGEARWRAVGRGGVRRAAGPRSGTSPSTPPAAGARRAAPGNRLSRLGSRKLLVSLTEKKEEKPPFCLHCASCCPCQARWLAEPNRLYTDDLPDRGCSQTSC